MNYFLTGKKITENFVNNLTSVNKNISFLVAGGLGYDSIKYKGSNTYGDYDFLCLVEKPEDIESIIFNKDLLSKMGFDCSKSKDVYKKDIQLFNQGVISIIGYSGIVDRYKTSINFSTYSRISSMISNPNKKFYKIRHGECFNLFIAKGTNGDDLIVCRISPEVSSFYNDSKLHFLVPSVGWLTNGDSIHLGIYTDMISKGYVAYDQNNKLINIQKTIWQKMVQHASPEISLKNEWYRMFASSHYFSKSFITRINRSLKAIALSINCPPSKNYSTKKIHNTLVTIFAEKKYYTPDKLSDKSAKLDYFIRNDKYYSLAQIINDDSKGKLDFMNQLHYINAESNRLSNLISLSANKNEILPVKMDCKSVYVNADGKFYYSSKTRSRLNLLAHLLDSNKKDEEVYSSSFSVLFKQINELRNQVTDYIK